MNARLIFFEGGVFSCLIFCWIFNYQASFSQLLGLNKSETDTLVSAI
jgi:hypothetical protein